MRTRLRSDNFLDRNKYTEAFPKVAEKELIECEKINVIIE
jgi:hypothetical protein